MLIEQVYTMKNMNIPPMSQAIIIIILTLIAIAIVTALSMMTLQQIVGIFYATTLDGVLITAMIVGSSKLIHSRLIRLH
jgi:hypothetical protein